MKVLKTILEQYRNGERGLPTYEELAAIVGSDHDGHVQINGAQADVRPVGWRPAFPSHRGDFTRGVPSDATVEHLRAQGVEIEYAYSRPATSEAARAEELRHALAVARDHMRVMSNWIKFSDPAAYSWSCAVIDRVNAALERGEQQ
ncbi:hypothetical protein 3Fb_00023 [Ralstonia phage Eline]|uniref:Uncharacterized protein n=1 Tax=Ralstonia phage Eline TaxID=2759724 RepID=A0A7G5B9Q3_9CAUD|nr:hypothetical protein KMC45_gp23 [Ralstonia phage Eline]QMV33026.1 hypothetical protein 3Fb_00023 [Ralstonia phage Eline]